MTSEFVHVINRSVVKQFLVISQFTNSAGFLIKYCRWRTNYQDRKIVIPLNLFKPATVCAFSKSGPGFPMSNGVVFVYFMSLGGR